MVEDMFPCNQITASNDNGGKSRTAYRTRFTGNNEWYTPARYVDLARDVMGGIDLDPASNDHAQKTVKAATYYTAETNGLDKEWQGRVWMNPPYSRTLIGRFVGKLVAEHEAGRVREAVVLTHNSTDTAWFGALASAATAFCFTSGRIRFVSPTRPRAAPAMGQTFTYLGPRPERFAGVFAEIGIPMAPMRVERRWETAA